MHAGKLLPVLFNEIVFFDFAALDLRECPLRVGRYLVAARKFRDHPQWAECVHRVPLPTSRRPVGQYARRPAHCPLGPRERNMTMAPGGCKPLFALSREKSAYPMSEDNTQRRWGHDSGIRHNVDRE